MRNLNIAEIRARFDKHQKLHEFEIDTLFDVKNLSKEQYRWLCKGYRHFTVFDIEAIGFDVRMGFMICWYALRWDILTDKTEVIYDRLEEKDMKQNYKLQKMDFDTRILQSLSDELKQADIVVGHYIERFDLPYFNARCHQTGQDDLTTEYLDARLQDTWKIVKKKYNLYNSGGNSLRNSGTVILKKDDKTSVNLDIWKTMYYKSHPKWKHCRKYICDHCELDVWQNFELWKKIMKKVPVGGASI